MCSPPGLRHGAPADRGDERHAGHGADRSLSGELPAGLPNHGPGRYETYSQNFRLLKGANLEKRFRLGCLGSGRDRT